MLYSIPILVSMDVPNPLQCTFEKKTWRFDDRITYLKCQSMTNSYYGETTFCMLRCVSACSTLMEEL